MGKKSNAKKAKIDEKSIFDIIDQFPNDQVCEAILKDIRATLGLGCPYCGTKSYSTFILESTQEDRYKCPRCINHYSVTQGTIFEKTKVPLRKWFIAVYLF